MSRNTVVERLLDFGFSRDEAKTYSLLLRLGPSPAGVISRRLRMNRVKVYRILKALEGKGAVGIIAGRPLKFVATPLKEMANQLIKEEKNKILGMEKGLDEIMGYLEKAQEGIVSLEEPRFRILQGRKQTYDFLFKMLERAETEICIMTTRNDLQRLSFYGVDDKLREVESKKVTQRLLTQIDGYGLETVENYLDFAQVRHVTLPTTIRFVVVDETEVLNAFAMDDSMSMTTGDDIGLWTNAKSYVRAMKELFYSLWRAAPDGRQVCNAVKAGKTPEQIKIVGTLEEFNQTFRTMLQSSNEEIFLMKNQIVGTPLNVEDLKAVAQRGVKIKLLTGVNLDNLIDIGRLLEYAQVMHNAKATELELLIVDKREVLVRIPEPRKVGHTTWSNLKPQVQIMTQIFEDHWIDSVPAQEILPKLATQQKLIEGLELAKKSLQASGWTVEVPGHIITKTGITRSFSMVAKHQDQRIRPLVLDLLVEEDALGQIVKLHAKAMDAKPALKLLASTRLFYKEESRLTNLYSIKPIHASDPKELATKITNEAKRILQEEGLP